MRCGQCQFENMPGLDRCFQCGAVLTDAERVDVNPPRMAGWKKPLRNMRRQIMGTRGGPKKEEKSARGTDWERYESVTVVLAAFLSILPGLGHVVRGQFKRVWWAVLIWIALIAAGIYLYGSIYGYWAIGVAIGLHAWIAVHWPDEEELRGFKRMGTMLAMMVVAAVLYNFVFHRVADTRLRWVHATFAVDAKNVQTGDVLLARVRFNPNDIQRGAIVVSDMASFGHGEQSIPNVISQVIGKPGDVVDVNNGRFTVNGKVLEGQQYNFPHWLVARKLTVVVPAGRFFLSAEYASTVRGRNAALPDAMVIQATVVDSRDVRGIIFMRWLPFGRRGFITEY